MSRKQCEQAAKPNSSFCVIFGCLCYWIFSHGLHGHSSSMPSWTLQYSILLQTTIFVSHRNHGNRAGIAGTKNEQNGLDTSSSSPILFLCVVHVFWSRVPHNSTTEYKTLKNRTYRLLCHNARTLTSPYLHRLHRLAYSQLNINAS